MYRFLKEGNCEGRDRQRRERKASLKGTKMGGQEGERDGSFPVLPALWWPRVVKQKGIIYSSPRLKL